MLLSEHRLKSPRESSLPPEAEMKVFRAIGANTLSMFCFMLLKTKVDSSFSNGNLS